MFCSNCGKNLPDGSAFCSRCGKQLNRKANNPMNGNVVMQEQQKNGCVYSLDGARGKHIDVYENKAVITTKLTVGSFLANNATDGEKTIYYKDCVGIQYKRSGVAIGYLQFETSSGMMNNGNSNFYGENSFTFDNANLPNEKMDEVADYVKRRIEEIKSQADRPVMAQTSPADEIKKWKELLDMNIITQEEFEAKKKQLLGL